MAAIHVPASVAIARRPLHTYDDSCAPNEIPSRVTLKRPPPGSISTTRRSLTLNEDYTERRNLRIACTLRFPWGDLFPPQASQILPSIYLADMHTATDPIALQRLGITHVVTVVKDSWYEYPKGIKQLIIPIHDRSEANLGEYLESTVTWIQRAMWEEGPYAKILVHCMVGDSRSAAVVVAYLMAGKGMNYETAMAYVKTKRPVARPNSGFMVQLRDFEQKFRQRERFEGKFANLREYM